MEKEPDPIGDLRRLLKESKQQTGPPPPDLYSDWLAPCWADPSRAAPQQKHGDNLRRF